MSSLDFKAYNPFPLGHDHKLTCDMGQLVPILCKEIIPGDIFRCKANVIMRLIPQLAPFMHQVNMYVHYFYVPSRLIKDNWEKFITRGFSGNEAVPWSYIKAPADGFKKYSLADYFGLSINVPNVVVDAGPFRAYAMIINEWYINENLQKYIEFDKGDGLDTKTPTDCKYRNWMNDYFTGCLPWAQRGDPVYLPLGTDAPLVVGDQVDTVSLAKTPEQLTKGTELAAVSYTPGGSFVADALGAATGGSTSGVKIVADLSKATAATVNSVRVAFQVQKWMERNARGGVRYVEYLLSHFGEKSSDARLQRPEYLGGGKSRLFTSEVLQTSSTDSISPQGNMSGYTMSMQNTMSFTRKFEEFGYVIGLLSVMPKTQYQQGIERMWTRKTALDYYDPLFAHLGQQAVLNKEIYAQGTEDDDKVFGFTDRYQELRTSYSYVSGDFRDDLDYWTMTRKFENLPQLNSDFVQAKDVTKRIFTVTNAQPCIVAVGFDIQALRKLPKHGTPGLIDHG